VLVADMHRVVEPLACTPDQLDGRHYGPKGMAKQLALLVALMQRSRLDAGATRAEKSGWVYLYLYSLLRRMPARNRGVIRKHPRGASPALVKQTAPCRRLFAYVHQTC
jgi:hypothetical protein